MFFIVVDGFAMRSSAFGLFFLVIISRCFGGSSGANFRNGFKDSGSEVDSRELERQNRITQQILQKYLERRLQLNLRRPSTAPSVWEILPPPRRPPDDDDDDGNDVSIQDLLREGGRFRVQQQQQQLEANGEALQSVESEQISSVYENEEFEDCPNCVDDSLQAAPNRWTMPLLKLGEKRYYLGIFFKANYFRATQYCRFHGMHLASITSQEENDKLEKYVKDFGFGNEHFWTSGTDLAEEGQFFWMSTGRPITFTNWNAGEPNNFQYENGEEENCLELWNRDGKGLKWNDSPCSFETYFVCEVQP